MASLFKRKGSRNWWISFRKRGKRWHRSLRYKHDVSADTRKAREECARQTLREMTESGQQAESRWEGWVPGFFAQRYATMPKTKHRYEITWRTFLLFFDRMDITSPAQIGYKEVMEFLAWRQNPDVKGVYPSSRNTAIHEVKMLGAILQEAVRRGYIVANPARGLGLIRDKPKEKAEITLAEEAIIRRELPNWPAWMQACFEIAMATGCRLRETAIDLANVDVDAGTMHFIAKGGRVHSLMIPPVLLPLFRRLKAEGAKKACELPKSGPSKFWWSFFRKVGLPHLCFHCIRVTVVTRLARAGIPERLTMRYVGHASSTVHAIYTKLRPADLQSCIEALAAASKPTVPAVPVAVAQAA
ncbi:MAG: tyrosine-type recombinase/integrase [Limisphaerales bacterium]